MRKDYRHPKPTPNHLPRLQVTSDGAAYTWLVIPSLRHLFHVVSAVDYLPGLASYLSGHTTPIPTAGPIGSLHTHPIAIQLHS